ncbi:hypothetical protein [Rhodobacter ferrooxidans]|uniref:Uncharacterized protein n=1 Tax=Rhodobacter ferrooxidans TaxID=371731 RepID=C8RZL8_9RHOB|nr:hypothetical protein [Rhodobacter sp. SW2]EEW25815.1 conserved hypothetical protein [Rhodobacter sp. SW2]
MDLNRLINMILNMVLRKLVNRGVNAGIDHVARRGKPAAEMTPEEQDQARKARQLAQRARQAAKITGRLGR